MDASVRSARVRVLTVAFFSQLVFILCNATFIMLVILLFAISRLMGDKLQAVRVLVCSPFA